MEYGIVYNDRRVESEISSAEYIFCAFNGNGFIYATDPYNSRLLIIDKNSGQISSLSRPNWFPRWIQIASDGSIIYLDSESRTIGRILNGDFVIEKKLCIQEPLFIKLTKDKTLLVGGKGETPLIELDETMSVIRQLNISNLSLRSAEKIEHDRVLVCDDQMQQVFITDWDGNRYWEYGTKNSPGFHKDHLFSPRFCTLYKDKYYIADGMNNRVLCINNNGDEIFTYSMDEFGNTLWLPSCIEIEGMVMTITDAHNKRIIDVNIETWTSQQHGDAIIREFKLKGPRGIAISEDESFIFIADTLHDRLVCLDAEFQGVENRGLDCLNDDFFWPRAVYISNDLIYVADSRNKRIVILEYITMNKTKEIFTYTYCSEDYEFLDLHDVRVYNNEILLCDALGNKVVLINESEECLWLYGENGELNDPHQASRCNDGNYIISDTGNNRVIKVNRDGEVVFCISEVTGGYLSSPRWVEEIDELLLITDSGNNRVILVDYEGNIQCSYGGECGLGTMHLRLPRYAKKWSENLIISDTRNNRVIKVPWSEFVSKKYSL